MIQKVREREREIEKERRKGGRKARKVMKEGRKD